MLDLPLHDQAAAAACQVHPRIVRMTLDELRAQGRDPALLCSDLGFSLADLERPDFRLSYDQASQAIRRVMITLQDATLGLRIGMRHHVVSFGLVGFGAMAASTLQAAGALALRFQKEAGSLLAVDVETGADHVAILAHPQFSDVAIEAPLVDGTYAALVCTARQLLDPAFRPRVVELVAPRPHDVAPYQDVFRCPVRFGCARNRMVVDRPWAHAQVATGDPMSLQRITALLEAEAAHRPDAPAIEAVVERRLRDNLRNPPTLNELAETMGMSERHLRRRLTMAGHSYGALLDQLRKTRAMGLLAHTRCTAWEIAEALGFSDPRSLRRAFRRWTGRTLASVMATGASFNGQAS